MRPRLLAVAVWWALLPAGTLHGQTPAPPGAGTALRGITVVGGQPTATTRDYRAATCEQLIRRDPSFRALIGVAMAGGDPYFEMSTGLPTPPYRRSDPSPLFAPTIYQPTRAPLNIDFAATPVTPPGSALPEVAGPRRGVSSQLAAGDLFSTAADDSASGEAVISTPGSPAPQSSIERGTEGCRALRAAAGGPQHTAGRYEIINRDTSLETAFALFEHHRYAESLDYFRQAFDKRPDDMGGDEASLMIGKLYMGAPGVERDMRNAVTWLDKAAGARFNPIIDMPVFDPTQPELNTATGEAAMILAALYRDGDGVPRNPEQSRKYLERAYNVGHIAAAKALGDLYYEGGEVPRDLKRAFRHYRDAAKFAHVPAMTAVARMYEAGEVDGRPDPARALAWRNEAAKLDDPAGLYALAVAYDRGEGVEPDPERALGFYKVAAMNGEPAALTALGTYFYSGEGGLAQDAATARAWFQQAALAADVDGMFNLAAMMAKGEGGEVDRVRAWGWLKIAEREGHPNAPAAVRALEAQFTADDRAGVEALARAEAAPPASGPGPDPQADIATEFVGVAPGGPPWWKVTKGGSTVWILGLPTGRITRTTRFNTAPLRAALRDVRMFITPYSPWSRVTLDASPFNPLPGPLGEKVTAAAAKTRQPLRNRQATFSDAVRTHGAFYYTAKLRDSEPLEVLQQAFRRGITMVTPPRRPGPKLATLPTGGPDVAACVEAMLADIDTPVAASKAAGEAWAAGDVAGALLAPRGARWACEVLWPNYRERTTGFYTEAVAMALDMKGKVVVAVDIGQLVAKDGVLPRLKAMGLEVSGPMQPTAQ